MSEPAELAALLKEEARSLGFARCGIAEAQTLEPGQSSTQSNARSSTETRTSGCASS